MRRARLIVFLLAICTLTLGCAHKMGKEPPVEELFQDAQKLAKADKVDKAVEAYMKVRTYYPGHELAKESLLAIGNLYYDHQEYLSALSSYQEFRLLYPTDSKAGYCLYRLAMCHFKQILSIDRDQTETASAIRAFEDFLKLYPDSPYNIEAREKLNEAKTDMAKNSLYIGKFYLKKKKLEAACKRFQYVKANFPDIGLDQEIDKLITQSCKH